MKCDTHVHHQPWMFKGFCVVWFTVHLTEEYVIGEITFTDSPISFLYQFLLCFFSHFYTSKTITLDFVGRNVNSGVPFDLGIGVLTHEIFKRPQYVTLRF